jgi:ATP-dependent exoDNAse (exonuclease V) beta subunit
MEAMDWRAGKDAWRATFRERLPAAPDVERADKEWALFEKSKLAKRLEEEKLVARSEMGFLAGEGDECVEGFIDLALLDERAERWEIVDWKTDRATGKIADEYGPQIRAYATALEQATGLPARAVLYATVTGELVDVH